MVNFSWINEQIAVSGAFLDEDLPDLKSEGVDAIVEVRSEYRDNEEIIKKFGMRFLHIAVDDRYSPTVEQLEKIFDFVDLILEEGKKVLIHCQNGCGRSPLVAIAILAKRGMAIPDAAGLIEDNHPTSGFTDQQEKFIYMELDKFLKNRGCPF